MHLFVILLLLYRVAMVTAVPGCLSDKDKDDRPRQNCTGAGFSDVLAGFELTTKVLLFPNNLFSRLPWSSFQVFPEIYEIDLTNNKIPELTPSAIPILPSLTVLRLGWNRLTSLSDGSFSACPALAELYLHDNVISSLSDNTFSGLSKLEILDLSSNHIQVLPELMLHPLPTIETLFLEGNKIKVMPDDWFSKKEEVPYLYLSANPWACSCSLGYLRRYLDDYEFNVYVRDGPIIKTDGESVVCDSPRGLQGQPVINLEESDLCSPQAELGPPGDNEPIVMTALTAPPPTMAATVPPPTTAATVPPPTTAATVPPPTTAAAVPPPTTAAAIPPPTTAATIPPPTMAATIPLPAMAATAPPLTIALIPTTIPNPPTTTPASIATTSLIMEVTTEETTDLPDIVATTTPQSFAATTSPTPTTQVVIPNPSTEVTIPSITSSVNNNITGFEWHHKAGTVGAAGVFCFWLFAGCILLCGMSAACFLITVARLFVWYRGAYKKLQRRKAGGKERVRLITYNRRKEKEAGGGVGEGVMALYRSVLFISKEGGEGMERGDGEEGGEGGREGPSLEPKGEGEGGAVMRQEGGGSEERGVYRKTLYRLISKQEEIEGWRDVMEECRVSARGEGGAGGGGVSRKRYSVILREEREVASGDKEELDWVVGGWEVKKGGEGRDEEPRSSWGEWLAHYLPSMPWGVTTPPEVEADQRCHQLAE